MYNIGVKKYPKLFICIKLKKTVIGPKKNCAAILKAIFNGIIIKEAVTNYPTNAATHVKESGKHLRD